MSSIIKDIQKFSGNVNLPLFDLKNKHASFDISPLRSFCCVLNLSTTVRIIRTSDNLCSSAAMTRIVESAYYVPGALVNILFT